MVVLLANQEHPTGDPSERRPSSSSHLNFWGEAVTRLGPLKEGYRLPPPIIDAPDNIRSRLPSCVVSATLELAGAKNPGTSVPPHSTDRPKDPGSRESPLVASSDVGHVPTPQISGDSTGAAERPPRGRTSAAIASRPFYIEAGSLSFTRRLFREGATEGNFSSSGAPDLRRSLRGDEIARLGPDEGPPPSSSSRIGSARRRPSAGGGGGARGFRALRIRRIRRTVRRRTRPV
jgi:hypothetical protein